MIYKSGKVGYFKSYEYAKTILSKMKKIISFKAFSNEEHDYYDEIDNKKNYYNLILFDEDLNEYWFDTNCGYKGMGSTYSEKILRLVGLRENYNIDTKKEIHETNLSPNNELNILVVEINLLNDIEKYNINSLIKLDFESAYLRYIALNNLYKLGIIKPVSESIGEELYIKYFDNYVFEENLPSECCINNILFLDSSLSKYIKSNISSSIKDLLGIEQSINIKEIKKKEYSIYGY